MCGIAGFVNLDGKAADPELLRKMAGTLRHRGPDAEGFFTDGNVGLAHRRLSVIDLSGGVQPFFSDDGSKVLIYNGEIFNFQELRSSLESKGRTFRTRSDTEVLLRLYEEYGTGFLPEVNGFFAFAIYDSRERRIVLARDSFGVKPLFWMKRDSSFAFASELSALKKLPSFPHSDINSAALLEYLALQYVPGPLTLFRGVSKLPPGSFLTLNLDTGEILSSECFRKLDFNRKRRIPYGEAKTFLRNLVMDAVEKRLVADVPLGVFLSGGLDSAVVASAAAHVLERQGAASQPLNLFSIGFPVPRYDESDYAKETAAFLRKRTGGKIVHHLKTVEPCDFSLLEKLAAHFGEPYADASMLPTYLLSEFARERVTVALSGDGADEVFAGYERYLALKGMRLASFLPGFFWRAPSLLLPASAGERSFPGRLKRFLEAAALPRGEQYFSLISHRTLPGIRRICGEELADGAEALMPLLSTLELLHVPLARDVVESAQEFDTAVYLPGDILPKVDISSMAASLEVRSPFLDYRIVEFASSLPRSFKQRFMARKRILADAFRADLPPGIASRPKKGFGVPLADWFRGVWKETLQERLMEGRLLNSEPYFRKEAVATLLREHSERLCDHSCLLFSLLMLELFFQLDD